MQAPLVLLLKAGDLAIAAEQTTNHLARLYVSAVGMRQLVRRDLGLTQNEATAFEYLRLHHPDPVRASDIARFCGISRSATTKLLDQLAAVGRVTRCPSERDRRAVEVRIAPEFLIRIDERLAEFATGLYPVLGQLEEMSVAPLLRFLRDLTRIVDTIAEDTIRSTSSA